MNQLKIVKEMIFFAWVDDEEKIGTRLRAIVTLSTICVEETRKKVCMKIYYTWMVVNKNTHKTFAL